MAMKFENISEPEATHSSSYHYEYEYEYEHEHEHEHEYEHEHEHDYGYEHEANHSSNATFYLQKLTLLGDRHRILSSPSQRSVREGRQSSLQRDCRGGLVAVERPSAMRTPLPSHAIAG
jgi:hypothetical protein